MFTKLEALYSDIAFHTDQVRTRFNWWPCRENCDLCCHFSLFHVSEVEALYMMQAVDSLGKFRKRAIRDKARSEVSKVHQKAGYNSWITITKDHGTDECVCPLLDDGMCIVYDKRPVLCRAFGYFLFANDGQSYWCERVADSLVKHKDEKPQAKRFEMLEERMKGVLWGQVKPIVAWLDVLI